MIQLKVWRSHGYNMGHREALMLTQPQTLVNCIDNSGAAIVECVKVLRMKRHAKVGTSVLSGRAFSIASCCDPVREPQTTDTPPT